MTESLRSKPVGPLASRNRDDHPGAVDQRCQIKPPHGPHPYGRIHERGGLAFWCGGKS